MPRRNVLPVLLLLFAGSGCAALIYEVVWLQLLQLLIGSSAVSLGVLLGTYMGGMCLGSVLLPRLISGREHPLRVYGWLELMIGAFGLVVLFGVPAFDRIYAVIALPGIAGIALRSCIAALFLLVPTMLMGASLPAIARWVEATPEGVSWLGYFYGGNIAGAVLGAVLAGFYLLRLYDMAAGTYAAVGLNVAAGGAALLLSRVTANVPNTPPNTPPITHEPAASIYLAIALSGLAALGAEVVWTRLLALMMGATVYTVSIILAVFLTGLGFGSGMGSKLTRNRRLNSRLLLGLCQAGLVLAIAWAAYSISTLIPVPSFDPTAPDNPLDVFRMDLIRCAWAILPAALLWGASFPLALAALAGRPVASTPGQPETPAGNMSDTGALVGQTYAANTLGGIAGALLFSMIVIPQLGTQQAQRLLIGLAALAALIVLPRAAGRLAAGATVPAAAATLLVAGLLMHQVRPVPWISLAYGRGAAANHNVAGRLLYLGEGMNSTVVVSELDNGVRYFHVSGKVEATTERFDMRLERMLGHISALFHASSPPKSVLVVGFGAGITAGAFTLEPGVEKITIDEIEPLIPPASTRYFGKENYNVLHDPRTQIHYDDARHFVLTAREKYDVITSDPIHPWVKGTSTLYSKEYFEMCKRHLKPGGLVTQWVPLYESDFETVKSELATFFAVFPHATVWSSDASNKGYDVVVVGQLEPRPIDMDELDARLRRPEYAGVVRSMQEVGLGSALDILSTYAGRDDDLKVWLGGAQINRDLNMRLQYLAGWNVNWNHPDAIFLSLLGRRTFPSDLFVGSPALVEQLRVRLDAQAPK